MWKIFIAINNFKVVTRFMGLFQAFVNVQCVPRYMYSAIISHVGI